MEPFQCSKGSLDYLNFLHTKTFFLLLWHHCKTPFMEPLFLSEKLFVAEYLLRFHLVFHHVLCRQ